MHNYGHPQLQPGMALATLRACGKALEQSPPRTEVLEVVALPWASPGTASSSLGRNRAPLLSHICADGACTRVALNFHLAIGCSVTRFVS